MAVTILRPRARQSRGIDPRGHLEGAVDDVDLREALERVEVGGPSVDLRVRQDLLRVGRDRTGQGDAQVGHIVALSERLDLLEERHLGAHLLGHEAGPIDDDPEAVDPGARHREGLAHRAVRAGDPPGRCHDAWMGGVEPVRIVNAQVRLDLAGLCDLLDVGAGLEEVQQTSGSGRGAVVGQREQQTAGVDGEGAHDREALAR